MKLKIIGAISAVIIFIAACQNEESIEFRRYYSSGALVYQSHCQNCHGDNGEGLSALIPPLNDSLYLKKNKSELACSIKSGLKGPVVIKGKTFDDAMPANDLSPIEIAQVLTYIGNSFGNKLNTINEQEVQTDLTECK
jgi:mono/diheme cytochrome c family protein